MLERELVVAVDPSRLEIEDGVHDVARARSARRKRAQDLAGERSHPATVSEHIGDGGDGDRGVERRVEPRSIGERRRHQPSTVDHAHNVAVALDAVLVAHRAPEARGRAPVHLANVVVGGILAHRFELRSQPERAATSQPLVTKAARPHRRCEPPRSRQVRVDEDLDGFLDAVRPRCQAERTATSCCSLRQDVASAPSRDE